MRCFFYSDLWRQARERLPAAPERKLVRWWDERADEPDPSAEPEGDAALTDPSLDPSVCGRLDGLIETFVIGWPRAKLVRRAGFGMEPPFRRMRAPYSPVVEMRTEHTRTFGFFVRKGVFLAHRLDLADETHADTRRYCTYGDHVLKLLDRMDPSQRDGSSDVEDLIG